MHKYTIKKCPSINEEEICGAKGCSCKDYMHCPIKSFISGAEDLDAMLKNNNLDSEQLSYQVYVKLLNLKSLLDVRESN